MAGDGFNLNFGVNNPLSAADKLEAAHSDLAKVQTDLHAQVADHLTNASMEIAETGRAIDAKVARMNDLTGKDLNRVGSDLRGMVLSNLGAAGEGLASLHGPISGTFGPAAGPSPGISSPTPCANAIAGEQSFDLYVSCGNGNLYAIPHGNPPYNPNDPQLLSCVTSESTYEYSQQNQQYWLANPPVCSTSNPPPFGGDSPGPAQPGGTFQIGNLNPISPITTPAMPLPPSPIGPPRAYTPTPQGSAPQARTGFVPIGGGFHGGTLGSDAQFIVSNPADTLPPGQGFQVFTIGQGGTVGLYDVYLTCPGNIIQKVPSGTQPLGEGPFNQVTQTLLQSGLTQQAADDLVRYYQLQMFNTGVAMCPTGGGGSDTLPPSGGNGGVGGEGAGPCAEGDVERPDGTCYTPCDPEDPNCCPQLPPPQEATVCNWNRPCAPRSLDLSDMLLWAVDVDADDYKQKSIAYMGEGFQTLLGVASTDDLDKDQDDSLALLFGEEISNDQSYYGSEA